MNNEDHSGSSHRERRPTHAVRNPQNTWHIFKCLYAYKLNTYFYSFHFFPLNLFTHISKCSIFCFHHCFHLAILMCSYIIFTPRCIAIKQIVVLYFFLQTSFCQQNKKKNLKLKTLCDDLIMVWPYSFIVSVEANLCKRGVMTLQKWNCKKSFSF